MTLLNAFLILAADPGKHTAETTGLDIPLLIGTIALVLLALAVLVYAFLRSGRSGRGRARPRHDRPSSPGA